MREARHGEFFLDERRRKDVSNFNWGLDILGALDAGALIVSCCDNPLRNSLNWRDRMEGHPPVHACELDRSPSGGVQLCNKRFCLEVLPPTTAVD